MKRGVTAAELFTMTFPPVRWVIQNYIAEGLTVLAGKPKLGKSWLVLDWALAVAAGRSTFGDVRAEQGPVLYCALEDTPARMKRRIEAFYGHFTRDPWPEALTIWTTGEMHRLNDGGLDQLREWIAANPGARVIFIDTLARVRGGAAGKEGSYEADYREMSDLKALADETGVSIVVVTHLRKMAADDPFDTVSGTLGITGAADATLVMVRDVQGVTIHGQGRDVEGIETALEWQPDVCRWRALGDATEVRRSDERKAVLQALQGSTDPMSPKEIAEETGHPGTAVRQRLGRMMRNGEIVKVGRGRYSMPPVTTVTTSQQATQRESGHEPADRSCDVVTVVTPVPKQASEAGDEAAR